MASGNGRPVSRADFKFWPFPGWVLTQAVNRWVTDPKWRPVSRHLVIICLLAHLNTTDYPGP